MDFFTHSDHPHSEIVDPAVVSKSTSTIFPVRRSKYYDSTSDAEAQFSREWYNIDGGSTWGGSSPVGSLVSFGIPDMEAKRTLPLVRLTEALFFIDDEIESLPATAVDTVTAEYYTSSNPELAKSKSHSGNEVHPNKVAGRDSKKQLFAKVLLEFYQVDKERAKIVVDAVDQYADVNSSPHLTNESWADFLRYRYRDGAVGIYFPLLIYALSLDLSQHDIETLDDITFPAGKALVLVNDVFSYDKEVCQLESADAFLNNGVAFIMRERHIGVAEAKKVILEEEIPASEQEFLERFRSYIVNNDPRKSAHMTRYLEAVAYMMSGHWYWSAHAERYFNHHAPRTAAPASSNPDITGPFSIDNRKVESQAGTLVDPVTLKGSSKVAGRAAVDENRDLAPPIFKNDEIILGPSNYLRSLPSKGLRGQALRAMNSWMDVPDQALQRIERIITYLHESSLMLDDIEDNSPLRRGKPTTHLIYGQPQTINAANYLYVLALDELLGLENPLCRRIYVDELRKLHIGQSHDLHWSQNNRCPTIPEYMEMVADKTGGLFCMLGLLMIAESRAPRPIPEAEMKDLMKQLGQFYQIRDDYQNLTSAEYEAKKGFAEDLDEGKYSLPLIHALSSSSPQQHLQLQNIMQQRFRSGGKMSPEMKESVLEIMREAGSFAFTRELLTLMETGIEEKISRMEQRTGQMNYVLRLLFQRLKIS